MSLSPSINVIHLHMPLLLTCPKSTDGSGFSPSWLRWPCLVENGPLSFCIIPHTSGSVYCTLICPMRLRCSLRSTLPYPIQVPSFQSE